MYLTGNFLRDFPGAIWSPFWEFFWILARILLKLKVQQQFPTHCYQLLLSVFVHCLASKKNPMICSLLHTFFTFVPNESKTDYTIKYAFASITFGWPRYVVVFALHIAQGWLCIADRCGWVIGEPDTTSEPVTYPLAFQDGGNVFDLRQIVHIIVGAVQPTCWSNCNY